MLYDTAIFMMLIFAIDVEIDVMPWLTLMAETKKIMDKRVVARLLLDGKCNTVNHACT